MKTKLNSIIERFDSLPIKQKIIFLASLGVVSIVLSCLTILVFFSAAEKFKQASKLAAPQEVWVAKSEQIERDLAAIENEKLNFGELDIASIESLIEHAAAATKADYTLRDLGDGSLSNMTLYRTEVVFGNIQMGGIIDFFNNISKIGDNVAISEIKIAAQSNMLLNARCIVSTLEMK